MVKRIEKKLQPEFEIQEFGVDNSFVVASDDIIRSAIAEQGILIIDAENRIEFASEDLDCLLEVPSELLQIGALRQNLMRFRLKRGDLGPGSVEKADQIIAGFSPGVKGTA